MSEKGKKKDRSTSEDKAKQLEKGGKSSKKSKTGTSKKQVSSTGALSLLADGLAVDSTLSSLFAVKQPPVKAKPALARETSEQDGTLDAVDDTDEGDSSEQLEVETSLQDDVESGTPRRKRKRKDADEDLEGAYMSRLAREEAKEAERLAAERAIKRQKVSDRETERIPEAAKDSHDDEDVEEADDQSNDDMIDDDDEESLSPPPKHETEVAVDEEMSKANRTVFLGNVSTSAIKSKASRKTLMLHLGSFFASITVPKEGEKHKVESIRFRSTPYSSAIPKKAAYAKQELMDATTKSTNAYAVYSSESLAREATRRLNGSVVLDRHLRVDMVAHPAKIDNRRCVFVGNLGFVDDESNIQQANEEEGREVRKRGKVPADVEEGLWRTFGKCGKVESVRVIRDSTTRVGKGIAYVQFDDENSVEAALLYDEKKFPPMLPRKLRVSRAKAPKRNAKPGSGRPGMGRPTSKSGYQRKITAEEASKMGRAGKLLGRAGAAQSRRAGGAPATRPKQAGPTLGDGIKNPENFIFEGHRASVKQGNAGLKLGGRSAGTKKVGVTKRSASFKNKTRKGN